MICVLSGGIVPRAATEISRLALINVAGKIDTAAWKISAAALAKVAVTRFDV
jgi:hypothetical protein